MSGARAAQAHRWGRTKGKIGFHGGKVEVERPRVRGLDGEECVAAELGERGGEDWLGKWAMNQMLINVSTRKFERSVRLPGGRRSGPDGALACRSRRPRAASSRCRRRA